MSANYYRDYKLNKQQLAEQLGVSRTTVYNQLKLLDLCADGQALVQRGVLGTELAMEIARIGGPEVQAPPVLAKVFYGADLAEVTKDSKAMSLRQGQKLLESIERPAGTKQSRAPAGTTSDTKDLRLAAGFIEGKEGANELDPCDSARIVRTLRRLAKAAA